MTETPISSTQLPPKAGYVEVEINGERTYRNVATGLLIDEEAQLPREPTEIEQAQQAITDLELSVIEQGQQYTDLELMILGGMTNV